MALITKFERVTMSKNRVHGPASCTYSAFNENGTRFVQIDTYGSSRRKFKGKKSQSIQLTKEGAGTLVKLLTQELSL